MKNSSIFGALICGAMLVSFTACENGNEPNNGGNNSSNGGNLVNGHEYVDLGLSVMWATCNIGASSSDEIGDYFAWGEVETKSYYGFEKEGDYKWGVYNADYETNYGMTKYNQTDGKTILDLSDDAAHVNWGGSWRMPTQEEQEELLEKCKIEWSYVRNSAGEAVNGYKMTGPNGNSIFFPCATGYYANAEHYNYEQKNGGYAHYWSSSIYEDGYMRASHAAQIIMWMPNDGENHILAYQFSRFYGCPIRPVYSK